MHHEEIITATIEFVKQKLANAEGAHDWWHIYRVWKLAKYIAKHEKVDMLTVELGALLHDIADFKFHNGNERIGPKIARDFLTSLGLDDSIINHVAKIIENVSFKGEAHIQPFKSPELDVVQDADRLDAIGAIGIARAFAFGGYKKNPLYDPRIKPKKNMTKEEYIKNNPPTINHFYEKLLLLKDRMNTKTGKKLALHRHKFMELFLEEFFAEWEGKK